MAGPQDILIRIAIAGQNDVISSLAGVGSAGESAMSRLERSFLHTGGALTGLVAGIAGIGTAIGLFAEHSAKAVTEIQNISVVTGTSLENMGAMESALAAIGGRADRLVFAFRRLGLSITRSWDALQKDARERSNKIVDSYLSVQKAQQGVVDAQNAVRDSAMAAQSAQLSASGASLGRAQAELALRKEMARQGIGPAPDKQEEDELKLEAAHHRVRMAIQAEQEAQNRLAESSARQAAAQLKLVAAEQSAREAVRKQQEAALNDMNMSVIPAIEKVVKGMATIAQVRGQANLTVENVIKGLTATADGAAEALKSVEGNLTSALQSPQLLEVLKKTADFFQHSGDAALNAAIGIREFGRGAGNLVAMLTLLGSEGLEKLENHFKSLGFTIKSGDVAREFTLSLDILRRELSVLQTQMGQTFQPEIAAGLDKFRQVVERNRQAIVDWAASIAEKLKPIIQDFFSIISGEQATKTTWMQPLANGLKELVMLFLNAGKALGAFFLGLTGANQGAVAEEWLRKWIAFGRGVSTVFSWIISALRELGHIISSVAGSLTGLFGLHLNAGEILGGILVLVGGFKLLAWTVTTVIAVVKDLWALLSGATALGALGRLFGAGGAAAAAGRGAAGVAGTAAAAGETAAGTATGIAGGGILSRVFGGGTTAGATTARLASETTPVAAGSAAGAARIAAITETGGLGGAAASGAAAGGAAAAAAEANRGLGGLIRRWNARRGVGPIYEAENMQFGFTKGGEAVPLQRESGMAEGLGRVPAGHGRLSGRVMRIAEEHPVYTETGRLARMAGNETGPGVVGYGAGETPPPAGFYARPTSALAGERTMEVQAEHLANISGMPKERALQLLRAQGAPGASTALGQARTSRFLGALRAGASGEEAGAAAMALRAGGTAAAAGEAAAGGAAAAGIGGLLAGASGAIPMILVGGAAVALIVTAILKIVDAIKNPPREPGQPKPIEPPPAPEHQNLPEQILRQPRYAGQRAQMEKEQADYRARQEEARRQTEQQQATWRSFVPSVPEQIRRQPGYEARRAAQQKAYEDNEALRKEYEAREKTLRDVVERTSRATATAVRSPMERQAAEAQIQLPTPQPSISSLPKEAQASILERTMQQPGTAGAITSMDEFNQAIRDATESVKEHKTAQDEATAATKAGVVLQPGVAGHAEQTGVIMGPGLPEGHAGMIKLPGGGYAPGPKAQEPPVGIEDIGTIPGQIQRVNPLIQSSTGWGAPEESQPKSFAELLKQAGDSFKTSIAGLGDAGHKFNDTVVQAGNHMAQVIERIINNAPHGGDQEGHAEGGLITGPGSGTSDSITAKLSNREFVMQSAATDHYGEPFMHAVNNMEFPKMALGGLVSLFTRVRMPSFAGGGMVAASSQSEQHFGTVDLRTNHGDFPARMHADVMRDLYDRATHDKIARGQRKQSWNQT